MDIITQASSVSLGELNARSAGDVAVTADELAGLINEGLVEIKTEESHELKRNAEALPETLKAILNSEKANNFFIQPTALGFKRALT
jgi:hypothetical protein